MEKRILRKLLLKVLSCVEGFAATLPGAPDLTAANPARRVGAPYSFVYDGTPERSVRV